MSLTGTRYFVPEEIRDEILDYASHPVLSEKVKMGLSYTEDDAQASMQFVLICPYEIDDDGNIKLHADFEDERPPQNTPDTIMAIYNVSPGSDPSYGSYESENCADWDDGYYCVIEGAPTMIMTHSSYLILKGAAPLLEPHIIYELHFGKDGKEGGRAIIEYGPTEHIMCDQYVFWPGLCGTSDTDRAGDMWRDILNTKGRSDEEILEDCWKGRGNMWALVRPDRFPIKETMLAVAAESLKHQLQLEGAVNPLAPTLDLPLDILLVISRLLHPRDIQSLMGTCKSIYLKLHQHTSRIVRVYMKANEPWFFPVGPFDIPRGDEEVQWWNQCWAEHGIQQDEMDFNIPWLQYRRACSHSTSMWNRIRIWRIANGLEATANQMGLIA